MSETAAQKCPQCHQYGSVELSDHMTLACPHCQEKWGDIDKLTDVFDHCPMCRCRQFYLSKDFNQFLGCLVMGTGIILVPFTFGLSLPIFALIDFILYRKVGTVINCYKCGCEFRGLPNDRDFKPFLHHIGLKYDKYR